MENGDPFTDGHRLGRANDWEALRRFVCESPALWSDGTFQLGQFAKLARGYMVGRFESGHSRPKIKDFQSIIPVS